MPTYTNMSNSELSNIFNNKKQASLIKNFYQTIPNWNSFLDYLYKEISKDKLDLKVNPEIEKVIGKVIVVEGSYFSFTDGDIDMYFPEMKEMLNILRENVSKEVNYNGGLISLGNRFVPEHTDTWDAINFQCIGSVEWEVSGEGYREVITVEPGDLVYVPVGLKHSVKSFGPRANLLFNIK